MNAAPISAPQIVGGMILSVFVRMFPTVGVYYLFMLLFGAVPRVEGVPRYPALQCWSGCRSASLIMAYTSTIREDHGQMAIIQRFILMPMFLFSGTFFPITQPADLPAVDRLDLAALARHASSGACSPTGWSSRPG